MSSRLTLAALASIALAGCGGGDAEPGAATSSSSGDQGGEASGGGGGGSGGEAPYWILAGVDPELPHDDLAPLASLIGDAPVVGLGESFHNLDALFRGKSRVIRFLVEEAGFRAVLLEAGWGEVEPIDAYVQTCSGTPESAVDELFWKNWHDHALADLLQWLCQYNQAHPADPVHVYGFDTQQLGSSFARDRLSSYLTEMAPEAPELAAGLATCAPHYAGSSLPPVADETHAACVAAIDEVEAWLAAHERELARRDAAPFDWAGVAAITLRAWEDQVYLRNNGTLDSQDARDLGMSSVFQELRSFAFPGRRAVTWAHNFHVMYESSAVVSDLFDPELGPLPWPRSMGSHLRDSLGDDYFALAFLVHDVDDAFLPEGASDPSCGNCLEQLIHGEGHPYLLLDAESSLLVPRHAYATSFNGFSYEMVPAEHFSGFVYVEESGFIDSFTGDW